MYRTSVAERIWYETSLPVFLERFILPILAAVLIGVIVVNPVKFDRHEQFSLALVVLGLAYFVGHQVYKLNRATSPTAPLEVLAKDQLDTRPHLAGILVIDSWPITGDPVFHTKIENIGDVQISDLRAAFSTSEMLAIEIDPKYLPRTLPPRGTVSISAPPVNGLKKRVHWFLL